MEPEAAREGARMLRDEALEVVELMQIRYALIDNFKDFGFNSY